eukprot:jgi/Bigna1/67880/fgenesh1_pg.4_\
MAGSGKKRGPKGRNSKKNKRSYEQPIPSNELDEFHKEVDEDGNIMFGENKDDDDSDAQEPMLDLDIGSSSDDDEYDDNYRRMQEEEEEEYRNDSSSFAQKYRVEKEKAIRDEKLQEKSWARSAYTSLYINSPMFLFTALTVRIRPCMREQAEEMEDEYEGMMEDLIASGRAAAVTSKKRKQAPDEDIGAGTRLHSELNSISLLESSSSAPVEAVQRDLSKLSKDDLLGIINAEAPELLMLLAELKDNLEYLNEGAQGGAVAGEKGNKKRRRKVRESAAAAQLASSCYAVNIAFYLLLKTTNPHDVREHPVMDTLMQYRDASVTLRQLEEEEEEELKAKKAKRKKKKKKAEEEGTDSKKIKKKKKKKKKKKTKNVSSVDEVDGQNEGLNPKKGDKEDNDDDNDDEDDDAAYFMNLNEKQAKEKEERRMRMMMMMNDGDDFDDDDFDEDEEGEFEDEEAKTKAAKKSKKKKKKDKDKNGKKLHGIMLNPQDPEKLHADGRRKAHKRILKNRGLTRIRNKKYRTPHLRSRHKFEKAMKKRRTQVRDFTESKASSEFTVSIYLGEKTGIKANIIKSTQLKP